MLAFYHRDLLSLLKITSSGACDLFTRLKNEALVFSRSQGHNVNGDKKLPKYLFSSDSKCTPVTVIAAELNENEITASEKCMWQQWLDTPLEAFIKRQITDLKFAQNKAHTYVVKQRAERKQRM